jgi:AhpD family alkylhydroperoxidase
MATSARAASPNVLVDLVYLRTLQINGRAYCINTYSHGLIETGVTVEKLVLLPAWRDAKGLFMPKEQAALQWAEAVTLIAGAGVPDATYQAAIAHFTEKELVDLTLAVGLINNYNRLSIALSPQTRRCACEPDWRWRSRNSHDVSPGVPRMNDLVPETTQKLGRPTWQQISHRAKSFSHL